MYKIAIFDFDGTLVDSAPGIVDVMYQVTDEYQLPQAVAEHWKTLIGMPLLAQVELICPTSPAEFHTKVVERYREIYDANSIALCPPFPHLTSMLQTLDRIGIASTIATSKRREIVEPVLDHHKLMHHFQLILGQQDVTKHKPHPELVLNTLKHLAINPHEAVVIGDSWYDLEMARNAGVDAIGVTTGVHSREELEVAKPTYIVENLEQATKLILQGKKRVA
ncbi:MAG: HAD family hydrolase [Candidatus Melainabacteria bacterium]|nr:HAD family hydrolase [Candidatus Melainabacteria bacterium]